MRARGASEVDEVESARRRDHERLACGSASAVKNQALEQSTPHAETWANGSLLAAP